eukprot:TRINITY_DN16139_c0_g1_i3.p1 TRINITY_DN16139_c0_g1~~TRINITY_DN16139_c0_g1_i3.p1  ORF type:complete len:126 (-),score=3.45 TRINITY_DN16139_c0_g1_i3:17-394(-)
MVYECVARNYFEHYGIKQIMLKPSSAAPARSHESSGAWVRILLPSRSKTTLDLEGHLQKTSARFSYRTSDTHSILHDFQSYSDSCSKRREVLYQVILTTRLPQANKEVRRIAEESICNDVLMTCC